MTRNRRNAASTWRIGLLAIAIPGWLSACTGGQPGIAAADSPLATSPAATSTSTAVPAATQTAAAAQATFVTVRATVTAAAQQSQATSTAVAQVTAASQPTKRPKLNIDDLADIGRRGVVFIERADHAGGSGAYLGGSRVLTNAHVVNGPSPYTVVFNGKIVGSGIRLAMDVTHDVALLDVPGVEAAATTALNWGDSTALREGDGLVVIGYPLGVGVTNTLGIGPTVTQGIVSARRKQCDTYLLQTDAAVNPGNSGGPMLNSQGELVGIATFVLRGTTGLNFGVASQTARAFVDHPQNSGPSAVPLESNKNC